MIATGSLRATAMFVFYPLKNYIVLQKKNSSAWKFFKRINCPILTKAGVTFDNSFFGNCFDLVWQLKKRSFLGPFSLHKKVEISISRIKSGEQLCWTNVLCNFFPTWYWSKLTLVKHNCCPDLVRLVLILTFNFFTLG